MVTTVNPMNGEFLLFIIFSGDNFQFDQLFERDILIMNPFNFYGNIPPVWSFSVEGIFRYSLAFGFYCPLQSAGEPAHDQINFIGIDFRGKGSIQILFFSVEFNSDTLD